MESFNLYGIALIGIVGLLLIKKYHKILRRIIAWLLQRIRYKSLYNRGTWSDIGMTVPQAITLTAFIGGNAVICAFDPSVALPRILLFNLIPLYLGRRMNIFTNFLEISLHVHQFAHNWLGRIVVTQALVHCGLSWTKLSTSTISWKLGLASAISLLGILAISIIRLQRSSPILFVYLHRILALAALCCGGGHIVLVTRNWISFTAILTFVAGAIFIISWAVRLIRKVYLRRAKVIRAAVLASGDIGRIWIRTGHSIMTRPGMYFYVSFTDLPLRLRFREFLLPVAFWDPEARETTREFSFLFHYPDIVATLKDRLERKRAFKISIDGPYGKPLKLEQYELVMLIANGIGIAGILPIALSLLARRKHDQEDKAQGLGTDLFSDKARKVDIIWRLDNASQVEWASSYFKTLSDIRAESSSNKGGKRSIARVSACPAFV